MRRLLPVLLCPLLAACGSSPKAADSTLRSGASAPASVAVSAGPSSTASFAVGHGSQAPAAVASPRSAVTPAASGAAANDTAPQGIRPGAYTYDTTGTVSYGGAPQDASGTATLTVQPMQGSTQRTRLKSAQATTEETVVFRSAGAFLSRVALSGGINKEFRPEPAGQLLPSPAPVGAHWSWSSPSTDGKTTLTNDSKVVRREDVTIGGTTQHTVVVQTHLVISGDVDYTADVTTWVVPSLMLVVKDHTVGKGTVTGLAFTTDITDILRAATPA